LLANGYIVVGASGIIGRQISARLNELKKDVVKISGRRFADLEEKRLSYAVKEILEELQARSMSLSRVGIIFAHRQRGGGVIDILRNEHRLCGQLIALIVEKVQRLDAIILGSITGSRFDSRSSEAYHYAKDFQKTCVRQSIRFPNLNMNLLELSWFEKYPPEMADSDYQSRMQEVVELLGANNVPNVTDITDFALQILEAKLPPRGQVISYDGGYSTLQR